MALDSTVVIVAVVATSIATPIGTLCLVFVITLKITKTTTLGFENASAEY